MIRNHTFMHTWYLFHWYIQIINHVQPINMNAHIILIYDMHERYGKLYVPLKWSQVLINESKFGLRRWQTIVTWNMTQTQSTEKTLISIMAEGVMVVWDLQMIIFLVRVAATRMNMQMTSFSTAAFSCSSICLLTYCRFFWRWSWRPVRCQRPPYRGNFDSSFTSQSTPILFYWSHKSDMFILHMYCWYAMKYVGSADASQPYDGWRRHA